MILSIAMTVMISDHVRADGSSEISFSHMAVFRDIRIMFSDDDVPNYNLYPILR